MISVTLREDEAKQVRLVLALFLHGLLNGETVNVDTLLSAFETAKIPASENPLHAAQPDVLRALVGKFDYEAIRTAEYEKWAADRKKWLEENGLTEEQLAPFRKAWEVLQREHQEQADRYRIPAGTAAGPAGPG